VKKGPSNWLQPSKGLIEGAVRSSEHAADAVNAVLSDAGEATA
jgi:monoamine oxidase